MARLSTDDIQAIKHSVEAVLGQDSSYTLWLFGSRANDSLRGGDIDLLVETPLDVGNRVRAAGLIYAKIIRSIGDRKIDLLLKDGKTGEAPIFEIARATGEKL